MHKIEEKQKIEIEYWQTAPGESPGDDSVYNVVNKISDARIFLECINRYKDKIYFEGAKVLELGGGQGWASCVCKKLFPNAHVIMTDISEYAIMSLSKWEHIFRVKIDNSYASKSYMLKEEDNSIDIIFCFAAAHHFLAHRRTLAELERVLKPGGKVFYLYEPASPIYFYRISLWRVNRKRAVVPEDVLVISKLKKLSSEVGLDIRVDNYPSLMKRGRLEIIYFFFLSCFPFLQKLLPCTVNLIFTKRNPP